MAKNPNQELDSIYILKLVLFVIVGAQWLRVSKDGTEYPIPIGALIGVLFAAHDHFRIDRKIEYAVLILSMFVGFWAPVGLVLTIN